MTKAGIIDRLNALVVKHPDLRGDVDVIIKGLGGQLAAANEERMANIADGHADIVAAAIEIKQTNSKLLRNGIATTIAVARTNCIRTINDVLKKHGF